MPLTSAGTSCWSRGRAPKGGGAWWRRRTAPRSPSGSRRTGAAERVSVNRRGGLPDPAQLEDPEVPPHQRDGDVVDGHGPDRALQASDVRVAVKDEIGFVLADRRRHPIGPQKCPDPLGRAGARLLG